MAANNETPGAPGTPAAAAASRAAAAAAAATAVAAASASSSAPLSDAAAVIPKSVSNWGAPSVATRADAAGAAGAVPMDEVLVPGGYVVLVALAAASAAVIATFTVDAIAASAL